MAFRIASSPHSHNRQTTSKIMLLVILACIPGILVQCYFFGYGNLIQIGIAAVTAVASEGAVFKLRKLPVAQHLGDNSALLTALLLAISLPPLAPWWLIVIGTLFAIIIAKQVYGGLGQNPFNPAMVGYVVLLISFPVQMTAWSLPIELQAQPISFIDTLQIIFIGHGQFGDLLPTTVANIDGVTQATPLDTFKTGIRTLQSPEQILHQPLFTPLAGVGWQWINLAFLVGGLFLLFKNTIQWQIPVSFLVTLLICSLLDWQFNDNAAPPLLQLFSGATMLGAFFIATDPVTASTTPRGRLIFGALIGALVWLIRTQGGYPDAVAFAVLLANITVPLIDHYTQPRAYGHR